MKQFWHTNIIEKSFQTLLKLNREFNFILIGGWAVYFWTKKMKSKDIDIVVSFSELGKIREKYDLIKNARLRKYEIKFNDFDIDIYVPRYSKIGFPLEKLENDYIQNIEGFKVPTAEVILLMKLFVFEQRKNSLKGEKDKIDIISLLESLEINWKQFKNLTMMYVPSAIDILQKVLKTTKAAPELELGQHKLSKLKRQTLEELT